MVVENFNCVSSSRIIGFFFFLGGEAVFGHAGYARKSATIVDPQWSVEEAVLKRKEGRAAEREHRLKALKPCGTVTGGRKSNTALWAGLVVV
jgi:hypothetical protein